MIENSKLPEDTKMSKCFGMSIQYQSLIKSAEWASYTPKHADKSSEYKLGYTNIECIAATSKRALKRASAFASTPKAKDQFRVIPKNQIVYIGKVNGEYCNIVIFDEKFDGMVYVTHTDCINERTSGN